MGGAIAHTEGFADVRSELVAQRNGQRNHQEQQERLPPISFVAEHIEDKQGQRQPNHLSRIEPHEVIQERVIAAVQPKERLTFPYQPLLQHRMALNGFYILSGQPTDVAILQLDLAPGTQRALDGDIGALMQDEEISTAGIG